MAFDEGNAKLRETLKETPKHIIAESSMEEANKKTITKVTVPFIKEVKVENKKNYTISMTPTIHKKINQLAKEHGYRSTSQFISDVFEGM